jgi:hypothetical protein
MEPRIQYAKTVDGTRGSARHAVSSQLEPGDEAGLKMKQWPSDLAWKCTSKGDRSGS